ncbi:hypothetical protein AX16_000127 [Volvariella volvacea WC 439]|nr:hypothetical protein AX16_000127 [Volvariella volvacea WC 439]
MATDFWASSHYKRWIVDRATVKQARAEDMQYVDDPEYLDFLSIYFANAIGKLSKKLGFRQRVTATATVFFRRFYLKNSYCETDPFLVIAACCYVAAKAEESPVQIKTVLSEARSLFSQEQYNVRNFTSENTRLAEMEFYLVDDLECDLTVFHPYRTLVALCKEGNKTASEESEEGETDDLGIGVGVADGPRYWGTGQGQLELAPGGLQHAWFIINDTYRSDLCLLYPPHLIAIAAIYLTLILHAPTREALAASQASSSSTAAESRNIAATDSTPQPRRSSRQAQQSAAIEAVKKPQDPISFLADLNVSLPLIATIAQEIISLYTLMGRYKEEGTIESSSSRPASASATSAFSSTGSVVPAKRSFTGQARTNYFTLPGNSMAPIDLTQDEEAPSVPPPPDTPPAQDGQITPAFLSSVLLRMRGARFAGAMHQTSRQAAVNKMLERTQAVG